MSAPILGSQAEVRSTKYPAEPPSLSTIDQNGFSTQLLTFKGEIENQPINILIDGGSSGDFVSDRVAKKLGMTMEDVPGVELAFANGEKGVCNKEVYTYLRIRNHEENLRLKVVTLPRHEVILGKPWLEKWNPTIDWRKNEIFLSDKRLMNLEQKEPDSVQVRKANENAVIPKRKTPLSAGVDLYAIEDIELKPGEQKLFGTGLEIAIPSGFYGQLAARSSLAIKEITVEAGVIDADFRGEIKLLLRNQGRSEFKEKKGGKAIAQLLLIRITSPIFEEVTELDSTERKGGF